MYNRPSPHDDPINLLMGRQLPATQDPNLSSPLLPACHLPPPLPPRQRQQQFMAESYQPSWKHVISTGGEAVRNLANILLDGEGTAFISNLEPEDAEVYIEILDHVSRDPYLLPAFVVSDGFVRASQNTTSKPSRNRLSSSR